MSKHHVIPNILDRLTIKIKIEKVSVCVKLFCESLSDFNLTVGAAVSFAVLPPLSWKMSYRPKDITNKGRMC